MLLEKLNSDVAGLNLVILLILKVPSNKRKKLSNRGETYSLFEPNLRFRFCNLLFEIILDHREKPLLNQRFPPNKNFTLLLESFDL